MPCEFMSERAAGKNQATYLVYNWLALRSTEGISVESMDYLLLGVDFDVLEGLGLTESQWWWGKLGET